jgi:transcription elongation factor SPT5
MTFENCFHSGGKKFFRMGKQLHRPTLDDDSDEEETSDEEDDDEDQDVSSSKKRPSSAAANANLSSDEDDDDDDDEDEDDDDGDDDDDDNEEEEDTKKRKKRSSVRGGGGKRAKVSSFIDEEAEDDDEDEEDDEPYGSHHDPDDVVRKHYTEEDIRKEQMDEEALELMRQQDRRRAAAGFRFGAGDEERSAQEMARDIEDRHRMSRTSVNRSTLAHHPRRTAAGTGGGEERSGGGSAGAPRMVAPSRRDIDVDRPGGPEMITAVNQQSLVPSVADPSLWMVNCVTGKEQELVLQIMNKCVAFARLGKPLGIVGAIAAQTKGKIYIESFGEPAVAEAINSIRGLMMGSLRLVPIQDMTTVMTVVPKKKPGKNMYIVSPPGIHPPLYQYNGFLNTTISSHLTPFTSFPNASNISLVKSQ